MSRSGQPCPPDCTCLLHRTRSVDERNAHSQRMREVHQRRQASQQDSGKVHQRCHKCGRILAPIEGQMPLHRKPRRQGQLTGADSPWCQS